MRRRLEVYMGQKGVTIPEVLVTIGILSIIFVVGIPAMQNILQRNNLRLATREITHALRRAQIRSVLSESRSNLGVRFISGTGTTYILFQGSSYASRDTSFDEEYVLLDGVDMTFTFPSVTSTLDVIFSRGRGKPSTTGTITLSSDTETPKQITIGENGRIQTE